MLILDTDSDLDLGFQIQECGGMLAIGESLNLQIRDGGQPCAFAQVTKGEDGSIVVQATVYSDSSEDGITLSWESDGFNPPAMTCEHVQFSSMKDARTNLMVEGMSWAPEEGKIKKGQETKEEAYHTSAAKHLGERARKAEVKWLADLSEAEKAHAKGPKAPSNRLPKANPKGSAAKFAEALAKRAAKR